MPVDPDDPAIADPSGPSKEPKRSKPMPIGSSEQPMCLRHRERSACCLWIFAGLDDRPWHWGVHGFPLHGRLDGTVVGEKRDAG